MADKIASIAKTLRKRPTEAEKLLWKHLRLKQIEGLKFRRQAPIDDYIVDFVCFEKRLIVEIDGCRHAIIKAKDNRRDEHFRKSGFSVLRFWNNEVFENLEGVLSTIMEEVKDSPSPQSPPVKGGEVKKRSARVK